ncbi:MAG: DNA polymerase III subunit delta' [Actinobacteria bacterium]|nr:DNA polymerase III subunit delta' [Actinomycetota bacterium]
MSASIWSNLVGQDLAITSLQAAVADARKLERGEPGPAMTHAWLITGPPGSGRSSAATKFAAALVCPEDGCGRCNVCRLAPVGGHPDVEVVVPEGSEILIDIVERLRHIAAQAPTQSPWRVIVVEDADRLTDKSGSQLLKNIEEPTAHTVWVLCAPSAADVLPTIASRTRHISLRTPSTANVAELLVASYGVDPSLASLAARASQGHIGRARALATDDDARIRRQRDLRVPFQLRDLASCVAMAGDIAEASKEAANARADELDDAEIDLLKRRYYAEGVSKLEKSLRRSYETELREMEKEQKRRRTRMIKDEVDRSLIDLQSLFRDVLILQLGADIELINEELRPGVQQLAAVGTSADTVRRLGALEHARRAVTSGVTVESVLESLMVELKDPWVRASA